MANERNNGNKGSGVRRETPSNPVMGEAFQAAGADQQAPQGQQQERPQYQQRRNPLMDIFNLDSETPGPLSRNPVGETVVGYRDCFQDILEKQGKSNLPGEFRMIILDSDTTGLPVSSLLVCYRVKRGGQNIATVYTALVEGGRDSVMVQQGHQDGRPVEMHLTTGDLYDNYYRQVVDRTVRDSLSAADVIEVGSLVIPSEVSSEEEQVMRDILFHMTTALVEVMDEEVGQAVRPTINADYFRIQNVTPHAQVDYNSAPKKTVTGQPVRSDVTVRLRLDVKKGEGVPYDKTVPLTEVRGYIDLTYDATAPQAAQQANPYMWQQPVQPQGPVPMFIPRFVITGNDSARNAITLEYQLLSLYAATLLRKNMAWSGVFRPNYALGSKRDKEKSIDLRDLGAITYQVNLTGDPNAPRQRIDTKADSFKPENLAQLIQATIRDALIFSMDVEEVGPLSWIHGTFVAASNNDGDATQAIIDAANNLTKGAFARYYQGGPVAVSEYNRVHMGYYTNPQGEKRDIREIDYLALLNLIGGKDIRMVEDFADTYDRVNEPLAFRLERRYRILDAVVGDSMKIKGYATRITFDPRFMEALIGACEDSGIMVRSSNMMQEFGQLGVRGNMSAAAYAVPGVSGSFGPMPSAGGPSYQPRGIGRFGWGGR